MRIVIGNGEWNGFYSLYDSCFVSPTLLRSRSDRSHAALAVPAWGRGALRERAAKETMFLHDVV